MKTQKPHTAKRREQIFALLMDNDVEQEEASAPTYLDDATADAFINRALSSFKSPTFGNDIDVTPRKKARTGFGLPSVGMANLSASGSQG